jgi:hypothetical protein
MAIVAVAANDFAAIRAFDCAGIWGPALRQLSVADRLMLMA